MKKAKPQSWKEILQQYKESPRPAHKWVIIGGGGSSKRNIRSWSPAVNATYDDSDLGNIFIKYKCTKCNIVGKKYIQSGGEIILENKNYTGLSCDEIIIKSIIE